MSKLQVNRLRNVGTEWLKFGPIPSALPEMSEESTGELKTSSKNTHNLATKQAQPTTGSLLQCKRFSSFQRLVRVTVYVLRAVRHFKGKGFCRMGPLSTEELHDAKCHWIKDFQVSLSGE